MAQHASAPPGYAFVFDYDHTVVNVNSDTWIPSALGATQAVKLFDAPEVRTRGWTATMDMVLTTCQVEDGKSISEIAETAKGVPHFPELLEVIRAAAGLGPVYIVSDANTLFIEKFVEHHGLPVSQVHTNPVRVENGVLRLHPYASEPHGCKRCPVNMCKGLIVKSHVLRNDPAAPSHLRPRIVYFGDGSNDFCPVVSVLQENDIVFARDDADSLHARGLIKRLRENTGTIRPTVYTWAKGKDLLELVKRYIV